jgi:hypothetical protein
MKVITNEIAAMVKIIRKFSRFHRNAKDMLDDRFTWGSSVENVPTYFGPPSKPRRRVTLDINMTRLWFFLINLIILSSFAASFPSNRTAITALF